MHHACHTLYHLTVYLFQLFAHIGFAFYRSVNKNEIKETEFTMFQETLLVYSGN